MKKAWVMVVSTLVVPVFVSAGLFAQEKHQQYVYPWRTAWEYEGARGSEHWSDLDPQYALCNEGKEQSPIDIRSAEKTDLPALRFEGKGDPLKYVVNNRYTIRVNYQRGNGNFLLVGGERYELTQFHFHHPSEEYIDGKPYEMEVHLMYQSGDGKVVGVTVFIKPGHANPTIQKLWEHMPKTEGQEEVVGVELNPSDLLPRDLRGFYKYVGSVTAPPCTEGVIWFVLKSPIEMSTEQIDAFAKLYPHDVRPIQPLNGRVVTQNR